MNRLWQCILISPRKRERKLACPMRKSTNCRHQYGAIFPNMPRKSSLRLSTIPYGSHAGDPHQEEIAHPIAKVVVKWNCVKTYPCLIRNWEATSHAGQVVDMHQWIDARILIGFFGLVSRVRPHLR